MAQQPSSRKEEHESSSITSVVGGINKFEVGEDGSLSFIIKEQVPSSVPEFIKKRFHSVLDMPESWEQNIEKGRERRANDSSDDVQSTKSSMKRMKRDSEPLPQYQQQQNPLLEFSLPAPTVTTADVVSTAPSPPPSPPPAAQQPRADVRKKRRNAIIPNSITQSMMRNVADGYHLELQAAARGATIDQEEIDLFGLHGRFDALSSSPASRDD
jgi:hypothetical protein